MINDIQHERIRLLNSNIYKYLLSKYTDYNIKIGNFGFIIIPNNKDLEVIKIYSFYKYYNLELLNYLKLLNKKIILPKILEKGEYNILGKNYHYIKFNNIRKFSSRFENITDIDTKLLGQLLSNLHFDLDTKGNSLLHANLDRSNFFLDSNNNLGIFDLVSMIYGEKEYDFAILYLNSKYNDNFLNNILDNYSFKENIDYNKIYKYTLIKIVENIKYSVSISENMKNEFRLDLIRLKEKIYNEQ